MVKSNRLALFFSTCFFIGFVPYIPGTLASLFTWIPIYLFPAFTKYILFIFLFCLFSILVIEKTERKEKDPRYIVIDECAGMFLTMLWHKINLLNLFLGFVLFRFFDILKPFPIKKMERLGSSLGILLDDIIAGIYGNLILTVILRLK